MAETEHITVATTSPGVGGADEPGRSVDLPVVELLTGRGFVTGKSGSGKSNTASVVAEKLLDNGFGMLVVDIDGEYYGLKEEYEILHVGADDECDIQVTVEHAEKIASLALEQNVPIILDISSFLDEDEAAELLKEVARHLFAKAKKQKQPFLMLVEECHEWIPENGSVGEVGQMLIKIGKRGRKHGLGMVGISQRPADVKKDYITQCDWLVWHRLTWNNDTKVVGRIIDSKYADAVEDLNDGEAFLQTDWSASIRRVQFHRKQTFDAGATPGLDDFERPELKSVSDDLVSELTEISEEKQQTEDRIAELRGELDDKNSRIAELEAELQDARDMSRMAEQFTDALLDHVQGHNPGRTAKDEQRTRRERWGDDSDDASPATAESTPSASETRSEGPPSGESPTDVTSGGGFGDAFSMFADDGPAMAGGDEADDAPPSTADAAHAERATEGNANAANGGSGASGADASDGDSAPSFEPMDFAPSTDSESNVDPESNADPEPEADSGPNSGQAPDSGGATVDGSPSGGPSLGDAVGDGGGTATASTGSASMGSAAVHRTLVDLQTDLEALDEKTRRMLAYYVEEGPSTPLDAHFSAGGSGDRTRAYAHNRRLRTEGFVEHVGRGRYEARLDALAEEERPADVDDDQVERVVSDLRAAITDG